uniref:Uncharacterized protein n=1 Tax=Anguilla anguilla TaxID=7936 RepID=A0A0E9UGX3_ANGAN
MVHFRFLLQPHESFYQNINIFFLYCCHF